MTDVSKAPGDVAMNALQNMPFGNYILFYRNRYAKLAL